MEKTGEFGKFMTESINSVCNKQGIEPELAYRNFNLLARAGEKALEAIKEACREVQEKIISPVYLNFLQIASADNPKWFYYYRNAKKSRTREKYRLLLQNKFLAMVLAEYSKSPIPENK